MIRSVLIANRGEIAVRITRACAELGIRAVAVHSQDDAASLHTTMADDAVALPGSGPAAYLDAAALIVAVKKAGCDAVHPGYGFLSESAPFAAECERQGIVFVGPAPATLAEFGDKAKARALARECGVPILEGTAAPMSVDDAKAFFETLGENAQMAIKAVAGGGGRGMRIVGHADEIEPAFQRCASEAMRAFGHPDLYAERAVRDARHVEIQIVGDGSGAVAHLHERECSIQRRHQKLVEIAPAPGLHPGLRDRLLDAAVTMAAARRYRGVGTFEFLISSNAYRTGGDFAFIEANPRLQVEHTVTEAITGLDLVQIQLLIAGGRSLDDIALTQDKVPSPRGHAIQMRINLEAMDRNGVLRPSKGTLTRFDPPGGPGVRTDTFAYAGYTTSTAYDPLLAKVIAHSGGTYGNTVNRARRALTELRIEGAATNASFLLCLLDHEAFRAGDISTRFLETHVAELARKAAELASLALESADTGTVLCHAGNR